MYPSEYAYRSDSVYRNESASANCRNYPSGLASNAGSENYIHCNGTQLRLTDSDIGSQQYTSSDYYVWIADESGNQQLLFTFPMKVNVANITLHYYHTSVRVLPGLRFWAVPDDFDAWDAPISSYSYVDVAEVPPSENSPGQRNVTIALVVITKKILMVKLRSSFSFALSEIKFFTSCDILQFESFTSTGQDSIKTDYLMSTSSVIINTSTVESEIMSRTLSELN